MDILNRVYLFCIILNTDYKRNHDVFPRKQTKLELVTSILIDLAIQLEL